MLLFTSIIAVQADGQLLTKQHCGDSYCERWIASEPYSLVPDPFSSSVDAGSMMCPAGKSTEDLTATAEVSQQYDVACHLHNSKRAAGEGEFAQPIQACADALPVAEGFRKVVSSSYGCCQPSVKHGQHKTLEAGGALQQPVIDPECDSADIQDVKPPQADCAKLNKTPAVVEIGVSTEESPQQEELPAAQAHPTSSDEATDAGDAASKQIPSNCVFFARVPPTVPYESIHSLFSQFGKVLNLNLFRPWASAKTSKGCGIVEYAEPESAMAAMDALHTKYHWTGGETTMVVEWMDPARHRKDKQQDNGSGQNINNNRNNNVNKLVRKRNKSNLGCVAPLNIAMALPGIGGRVVPLMAATTMQRLTPGLQGITPACANLGLQQASWMMGAHAATGRRASCPGSVGAAYQLEIPGAAGSFGNMAVDGSLADTDALWQALGCGTPNLMPQMMSSIPAQLAAHSNGLTGAVAASPADAGICAASCNSWPLTGQTGNGQLPQGSLSTQSVINVNPLSCAPNVASMLLQRHQRPQGWAALMPTAGSFSEHPAANGSYLGSEPTSMLRGLGSMGDLERCLGNIGGVNQVLAGLANGAGGINGEASALATAELQYLADLQGKMGLLRTNSPMAGTPNSLFNNNADGSFAAPVAATYLGTNDAASWLMAQGAGQVSGSPIDAGLAPGTPTYLQQAGQAGLGSFNAGVTAHSLLNNRHGSAQSFGCSGNPVDPQLAAVARLAGSGMYMGNPTLGGGSSSNLMMQLMCDGPAGSNMSNLIAAGTAHAWGGI